MAPPESTSDTARIVRRRPDRMASGRRKAAQDQDTTEALSANAAVAADTEIQRLHVEHNEASRRRKLLGLTLNTIEKPDADYLAAVERQKEADAVKSRAFTALLKREAAIREAHRSAWQKLSRKQITAAVQDAEANGFEKLTAPVVKVVLP